MTTKAQLIEALKNADAAGDTEAARKLAMALQNFRDAAGPEDLGLGNALRQGLQQGATFGFSDEISAAARAAFDPLMDRLTGVPEDMRGGQTFGERYRMYRDDERQQIAAGREHHPGAMMAAEFVPGLLAGGAGVAKTAAGGIRQALGQAAEQSLRSQLPRLAATGAGYGGLAGAGYSEADTAGGVASDALVGAGFGAGLGVGLPVAGAGVKRGVQNIGRRFGMSGAEDAAMEAARRQIIKDLRRDGLTPAEATEVLRRNPHYYLADVGAENVGESLEHIMQNPGAGRQRLRDSITNRQVQAIERMRPALREGIEQSPLTSEGMRIPQKYSDVEKAIVDHSKTIGKPLWETAYRPNVRLTPWLQSQLRGSVQKNGKFKYDNKRIQRAAAVAEEMLQDRIAIGEITPDDPAMKARFLDEMQRALRDMAKATGAKARSQQATSRGKFHEKFVDELKKVMGEDWQTARKVWAGRRANEEALEAGGKIFTGHVGQHQTTLSKMSMSERDHYLIGALRAIEDKIMKKPDTGDLIRELRDTARGKEVVKLLFGGETGFRRFLDMADVEERMAQTYARMQRGSATYGRGAKSTDVAEAGGTILGLMFNIPGLPWLSRLAGGRMARAWEGADEAKRNAMAQLMLTRNPEQLTQQLTRPPLPMSVTPAVTGLATATQLPGLLE